MAETITPLIEAVATLLWPLIVVVALVALWPFLTSLTAAKGFKIKVGDYELTLDEASANIGTGISDLQAQLATLSQRLDQVIGGAAPPPAPQSGAANELDATFSTAFAPDAATPAPSSRRILWVDDVPAKNAFLIERLNASGFSVDVATSTASALAQVAREPYALVISDLGRTEDGVSRPLAGLDLIEGLRRSNSALPILVFSSARAVAMTPQLIAAGATKVTSSGVDVVKFVESHAAGS